MQRNEQREAVVPTNGAGNGMQVTIFLPADHNDGSPQVPAQLLKAEQAILDFAGGLTRYPPSVGYWVDAYGQTCHDRVIQITVVAPADSETVAFFSELAAELATYLNQQMIFWFASPVWQFDSGDAHTPLLAAEEDLDRLLAESPLFASNS